MLYLTGKRFKSLQMKYIYRLLILILLISSSSVNAQQKINTIAGTGITGFYGDGGSAPAAEFHAPIGVAVDMTGNVYIDDYSNNRIRKINANGLITTVVGNGTPGNSGNGSIATSCEVIPHSVAVDRQGNVYMSDANYSVVRKMNAETNIITTVAGNSVWGYSGNGGPAVNASLRVPLGIALDTAGNLYIADAGNHCIRKVDAAGIISTIAGIDSAGYTGTPGLADTSRLDSPTAVAVDLAGNVYITDYGNNVIRKVDVDGFISTFAGTQGVYNYAGDNGLASLAQLYQPQGIAVDAVGNVYFADSYNNVIRKVDTFGIIHTVVGNGTRGFGGDLGDALGANLSTPYGIALNANGDIYIADANNERIRKTYPYAGGVGVNSLSGSAGLLAYPNPFVNNVTVSGLDKTDKVSMYDILGRTVALVANVNNAGVQTFTLDGLAAGIYVLKAWDASGIQKATIQLAKE
jgi:type IX secretion system substrate protein/NHL repeat-containing protein